MAQDERKRRFRRHERDEGEIPYVPRHAPGATPPEQPEPAPLAGAAPGPTAEAEPPGEAPHAVASGPVAPPPAPGEPGYRGEVILAPEPARPPEPPVVESRPRPGATPVAQPEPTAAPPGAGPGPGTEQQPRAPGTGQGPPQEEAPPGFQAPAAPPPGYFYPHPWFPVPFMPPGPGFGMPYGPGAFGEMPPRQVPGQPTGPMPLMGPQGPVPPGMFPPGQVPGAGMPPGAGYGQAPFPPPPMGPLEDEEFEGLAAPQPSHWRGDLKWLFGVLTAALLFLTLLSAGLYRATSPGSARQVLVPLLEDATSIEETVRDNYRDLRARARRFTGGSVAIPDIGVSVSLKADDVETMSPDELAHAVISEAERQVYQEGDASEIPTEPARGAGEERAKAVCLTLIGALNSGSHSTLLWVLLACGLLALAFGALFLVFCNGWGRLVGAGTVMVAAALPTSLALRMADEFIWKPGSSGYRGAMSAALRELGSVGVIFFDLALALGALLLLAGIVAGVIVKKSRERVPPFLDLKRPEEAVAGGAPLEPGLEPSDDEDLPLAPFADVAPGPGDSIKNP